MKKEGAASADEVKSAGELPHLEEKKEAFSDIELEADKNDQKTEESAIPNE